MLHLLSNKEEDLKKAGLLIKKGTPVIFPTETVYGIGADGLNEKAIKKVFEAKGRPSDNPLILHIADKKKINELGKDIPPYVFDLIDKYWPGPLSIIVKASDIIPNIVRCNLPTVAIRMPSHPVARKIIEEAGGVVAAPSSNISGRPSPTTYKDALNDAKDMVDLSHIDRLGIVDGGDTDVGIESTVLLATSYPPVILRPGHYGIEDIMKITGHCEESLDLSEVPLSPGMKYGHYMAKKPTILFNTDTKFTDKVLKEKEKDLNIAFLAADENEFLCKNMIKIASYDDPKAAASKYFKTLRLLDEMDSDIIVIQAFSKRGIGRALFERMRKSARNQVIEEENYENWIW